VAIDRAIVIDTRAASFATTLRSCRTLDSHPRAAFAALGCAGRFLTAEQEALFGPLASQGLDGAEAYAGRAAGGRTWHTILGR
jgi:hypothetical protein